MALTRKPKDTTDVTFSLGGINKKTNKPNPTSVDGYYMGFTTVTNDFGEAKKHQFQTANGLVGVWGKTRLDRELARWKLGTRIVATVLPEKVKAGKFMAYEYDVAGDEQDVLDVQGAAPTEEESSGDDRYAGEYSDSDEEETSVDEVAPPRTVAPRQPTAAPSAANQAKTKALLAKGRGAQA